MVPRGLRGYARYDIDGFKGKRNEDLARWGLLYGTERFEERCNKALASWGFTFFTDKKPS